MSSRSSALSDTEIVQLADALCWRNLADYVRGAFAVVSPADTYSHNWHIDCVAEHLHALHNGDFSRLIINISPRSLKSIICTVAFPAWALGRDPRTRIITSSYAENLSIKHSVDTRLLVESDWNKRIFPHLRIAADQNEKKKFMTTMRGFRMATSVGGSITGEGGDLLILDDPMKPNEVTSDVVRNSTLAWIDQVFLSRLNNPKTSRVLLVEQRLHTLDVTGHLMEKGGWHQVKIPAEATKPIMIDLGRHHWEMQTGDLMHEARMDRETLDRTRNELGDYAYAGQYLQEPVPDGGQEIKPEWFQYYDIDAINVRNMRLYMVVDPGGDKKKPNNDYTAMMLWGLGQDKNYYLLWMVRDRLDVFERIAKVFEAQRLYNYKTGRAFPVLYKSRSFVADLTAMKQEMSKQGYHFPLIDVVEKGEKNQRIRRAIPAMRERRVYLPRCYTYVDHTQKARDLVQDLLNHEVATFPVARHDDMLDATSELFNDKLQDIVRFPAMPAPVRAARSTADIWGQ